jgi:asparagine synthetase B (glutamine-hydrolysing)
MGGIAGLLKIRGPVTPEDSAAAERMTHAQSHQGPDGSGMYRVRGRHGALEAVDYRPVRRWQAAHGQRGRYTMGDI